MNSFEQREIEELIIGYNKDIHDPNVSSEQIVNKYFFKNVCEKSFNAYTKWLCKDRFNKNPRIRNLNVSNIRSINKEEFAPDEIEEEVHANLSYEIKRDDMDWTEVRGNTMVLKVNGRWYYALLSDMKYEIMAYPRNFQLKFEYV
jgi:hypothetical protein